MAQVDRIFFFRAARVSNKKTIVSHASPALKFTISLKIIAKNYFHLNCTGRCFNCLVHNIVLTLTLP